MLVAGNYVSSTGGAGDARQFSIYVDVPIVRNLADGPDEIVKAVRTNLKNGADFIKILATGAVLSKGIPPGRAAVLGRGDPGRGRARRSAGAGTVAAHAHGADGIKAAIRAGVRTVDHGSMLDDEAVAMLKARADDLLRAHAVHERRRSAPSTPTCPESEKERERADRRDAQYAGFRRALAAGLPIGLGTDAAVIPHGQNAQELSVRVGLGETPMAALVSATRSTPRSWAGPTASAPSRRASSRTSSRCPATRWPTSRALERVGFVMKGGSSTRTS